MQLLQNLLFITLLNWNLLDRLAVQNVIALQCKYLLQLYPYGLLFSYGYHSENSISLCLQQIIDGRQAISYHHIVILFTLT